MRKASRRFNKFITDYKDREIKMISDVLLGKILLCAEDRITKNKGLMDEIVDLCIEIKGRLVPFAKMDRIEGDDVQDLMKLLSLVAQFNKTYTEKKPKKKNKKISIRN